MISSAEVNVYLYLLENSIYKHEIIEYTTNNPIFSFLANGNTVLIEPNTALDDILFDDFGRPHLLASTDNTLTLHLTDFDTSTMQDNILFNIATGRDKFITSERYKYDEILMNDVQHLAFDQFGRKWPKKYLEDSDILNSSNALECVTDTYTRIQPIIDTLLEQNNVLDIVEVCKDCVSFNNLSIESARCTNINNNLRINPMHPFTFEYNTCGLWKEKLEKEYKIGNIFNSQD